MRYVYRNIKTQNVEVRGSVSGFCYIRIDETTIPDGKFPYVVAGDDGSGGDSARIKEHIQVKFFGTLICGTELSLEDEGTLWVMIGLEVEVTVSRNYKEIRNGNGTTVQINQDDYISIGRSGEHIIPHCKYKVLVFSTWEQFIAAVDQSKCNCKDSSQKGNEVIGSCIVNGDGILQEFKRSYYRQGWIFKNPYSFKNEPKKPCYVPELSNTIYTGEDFLNMCNNQAEIAEIVFEAVDWQHPETYLDEQYATGEMTICDVCGKIFLSYEVEKCPYCEGNGA
jgi:rubrerythrin